MRAKMQCPNCKEATLVVGLSEIVHLEAGRLQGNYSTLCPLCGPIAGTVIFETAPIESADIVSA